MPSVGGLIVKMTLAAMVMTAPSLSGAARPEASAEVETFPAISLPDTIAGRFVAMFTDAYNSADAGKLQRCITSYGLKIPASAFVSLFATTGRMTPVRITSDGPNKLIALFALERGDQFWQQTVSIDPAGLLKVEQFITLVDRPPEFAIPREPRAQLNAAMTGKLAQDAASNIFSGTIIVQRHGKIIYQQAVGLADRAAKIPVSMDTKFRLGSANKMFTAIAALQLVDQGKVSLDGTVATYLKDYPNADFAKRVTIRQLLSHTGGAGDIFTPEYFARRLETKTLADYVALFGHRDADESKDGKGRYANYGFVLLGRIVEVVSGEDYYDYVQRHIFAPAGMIATASLPEDVAVPLRSRGYTKGKSGQLTDNADTLPYRGSAAGGGYTTAGDMIRFGNALLAGKLLSPKLLAMATSPQRPDGWYGFGFMIEGSGVTRRWGHGGGAPGMNSAFRVYPELDAMVIALANLDPMAADDEANFYLNRMALKE